MLNGIKHPTKNITVIQPTCDDHDYQDIQNLKTDSLLPNHPVQDPFDWVPGRSQTPRKIEDCADQIVDKIHDRHRYRSIPDDHDHDSHDPRPQPKLREFAGLLHDTRDPGVSLEDIANNSTDHNLPQLRTLLKEAVCEKLDESNADGYVEHEDHHGLRPGMLVIEEVFWAIHSFVNKCVYSYNAEVHQNSNELENNLLTFVDCLNGAVGTPQSDCSYAQEGMKYAHFIHGVNDPEERHSTRIVIRYASERPNAKVKAFKLIVGAWRGGTHSTGSPH